MIRRLVEEENISAHEHRTAKGELHLPASGERRHRIGQHLLRKADVEQSGLNLCLLQPNHLLVGGHEVEHRQVRNRSIQVVLHVDGLEDISRREALDLAVGNGSHQGRLARPVATTKAVAMAPAKQHRRVVEQNLGTVREAERAVAQHFTRLFNSSLLSLGRRALTTLHLGQQRPADSLGHGLLHEANQERGNEARVPQVEVELSVFDKAADVVLGNRKSGISDHDRFQSRLDMGFDDLFLRDLEVWRCVTPASGNAE
mmetsp:Transcript_8676/g.14959  ORF Transcript_8676/g.14959 Transcript_8676/m.14959 type:complete len:258 (-) Transcript_8676:1224-1997(-)